MAGLSHSEEKQRERYSKEHVVVESHCVDPYSLAYRARFIDAPLGEGLELEGKQVLEAMCSGGYTTAYLLSRGAQVTGLDLSPELIENFRRKWPTCKAVCASVLETGFPDASFDAVFIMGGLHHVHPHVEKAVAEIHRVLKPSGYFCFVEPHSGSLPDIARKVWYKLDRRFERNEKSVDCEGLAIASADRFESLGSGYFGNIAYLLVFSSRVLKIPLGLKGLYSPALLAWEGFIQKFLGKRLSCYVVCRWRKRSVASP